MIAIHGLGYVGLTCAVHFARAGKVVYGHDVNPEVVNALNKGEPKAGEFLGYLAKTEVFSGFRLRATTKLEDTKGAEAHIVCVPTEKNDEPYTEILHKVLDDIYLMYRGDLEAAVHHGRKWEKPLIIVESTITPGFLRKWIGEHYHHQDFFDFAHAPRRDWFADPEKNLENLPRIVGGATEQATKRATEVLSAVSKTILLTNLETAELTKPLENALLHAQIAVCLSIAKAYPQADVAEAVKLAGTHWRLPQLHLSFGTGGRCVPLGPKYLRDGVLGYFHHLEQNLDADMSFSHSVTDAVKKRIYPPASVLVLGVAYRPNFKDAGSSPGLRVAKALWNDGYHVFVNDPMWSGDELAELSRLPVFSGGRPVDVVLLATPHDVYTKNTTMLHEQAGRARFVLDAQGAWKEHRALFKEKGVEYICVGEPGWR